MKTTLLSLLLVLGLGTTLVAQEHVHVTSLLKLNKSFIIVNSGKYMLSNNGIEDYVEGVESPAWSLVVVEKKIIEEGKPEKRVYNIVQGKYYLSLDPEKKTLYTSAASGTNARWIIKPSRDGKVTIYNEAAKNWIGVKNGEFIVHLMASIDWELIRVK